MSTLNVNNINEAGGVDAVITAGVLDSGSLPAGSILQVVRSTSTANFSTTSTSAQDVTDASITITPKSSTSRVFIQANFSAELLNSGASNAVSNYLLTDSSNSTLSGAERNIQGPVNLSDTSLELYANVNLLAYIEPGATSSVTYKLRAYSNSSSVTTFVRGDLSTTQLIAWEVAA